jgi:hypothetical protein
MLGKLACRRGAALARHAPLYAIASRPAVMAPRSMVARSSSVDEGEWEVNARCAMRYARAGLAGHRQPLLPRARRRGPRHSGVHD